MLHTFIAIIPKGNFTTVASLHIICSARGESVSLEITDLPDCIGKSCDESVLDSEENRKELANEIELVFRCKCIYIGIHIRFICVLCLYLCQSGPSHVLNVSPSLSFINLCHEI